MTATHRVPLHFKVLKLLPGEPPRKMTPDAMKDHMSEVYAPHGIDVDVAPAVEELDLEVLTDLTVGGCTLGHTTTEQKQLFAYRKDVPDDEICVYFVASTHLSWAGCASRADADPIRFPNGRPAAVVTSDASAWTLAHECGHVLGLTHVDPDAPITRLMVRETADITANPAALDAAEVVTIKHSPFVKPPTPGPPGPPPAPAPAGPAPAPRAAPGSPDQTPPTRSSPNWTRRMAWQTPSGSSWTGTMGSTTRGWRASSARPRWTRSEMWCERAGRGSRRARSTSPA